MAHEKKKKAQKKKKHILHSYISTKLGVLLIIFAAIPVAMMANALQSSQLSGQTQMVEGIALVPHEGFMTNEGTPSGRFHCPPNTKCYPIPSIPFPTITCIPRPPCLDAASGQHRCYYPEPKIGWCSHTSPTPSISQTPLPTLPVGCFAKRVCLMETNGKTKTVCPTNNPNCTPCQIYVVCPSGTPTNITPSQKPTSTPVATFSESHTTTEGNFFTNFFKNFFRR